MTHFPLIENLARSNGTKLIWAVCADFCDDAKTGSLEYALDAARTPGLDHLCSRSETGLMRKSCRERFPPIDLAACARLSMLEINLREAPSSFSREPTSVELESVDDLIGVEQTLAAQWAHYDSFLLNLASPTAGSWQSTRRGDCSSRKGSLRD